MSSPSDADLLRRFVRERAEDAFAELVRRHIPLVYRAALRQVGDPHRAQDVTQAVFTALAWKAPSLQGHGTLVGWLYTATRFAANDIRRSECRRRIWEQEASRMHDIVSDPTASTEWEKVQPMLDEALGELSEHDREAILLRFFSDQSFTTIGAVLNVSENTARMRVDRALDKLHGLLARRGITSTSTALASALAQQAVGAPPAAFAASVASAALASTTAGLGGATAVAATGYFKTHIALGAAAALFAIIAVQQNTVARWEEAQAAALSQQVAAAAEKIAVLRRDVATARTAPTAVLGKITFANASAIAAPEASAEKSQLETIRDNYLRRRAVAWSNPEYQRIQSELSKWQANQEYRPLFQRLNLSPARVAQFETLIAEHQSALTDILAAANTNAVTATDSTVQRLQAAEREKLAAQMRELLGPSDYTEYERYRRTVNLRERVTDQLATLLYASSAPLTAAQAETLTQTLASHAPLSVEGIHDDDAIAWDAAMHDARNILVPAQFEALHAVRATSEFSRLLSKNLSPLVAAAAPTKPAGK